MFSVKIQVYFVFISLTEIAINEDGCEHADHCAEDAALCSDMGLCVCPTTHFVDGVGCTLSKFSTCVGLTLSFMNIHARLHPL